MLVTCSAVFINAFGQDRSTFPIKEKYDRSDEQYVNQVYHPCQMNNVWPTTLGDEIGDTFGDGLFLVMESCLKMYEVTGDLAYLYRFVNCTICVQEHRWDELGIESNLTFVLLGYEFDKPRWSRHIYQNGDVLATLGHFVHLVQVEHQDLETVALPQFPETPITENSFGAWATLGEFAEWLRVRAEQTLDYYVWYPCKLPLKSGQ